MIEIAVVVFASATWFTVGWFVGHRAGRWYELDKRTRERFARPPEGHRRPIRGYES